MLKEALSHSNQLLYRQSAIITSYWQDIFFDDLYNDLRFINLRLEMLVHKIEIDLMQEALKVARQSMDKDRFHVGALLVSSSCKILLSAFTGEIEGWHAEEILLLRAKELGVQLDNYTLYSTLEPCSKRASRPLSCTQLIIESGIKSVVYAAREPADFVECKGHKLLENSGIKVTELNELSDESIKVARRFRALSRK